MIAEILTICILVVGMAAMAEQNSTRPLNVRFVNDVGTFYVPPHYKSARNDFAGGNRRPVRACLIWNGILSRQEQVEIEERCGVEFGDFMGDRDGYLFFAVNCKSGGASSFARLKKEPGFHNLIAFDPRDKGTKKVLRLEPYSPGEINQITGNAWAYVTFHQGTDSTVADSLIRLYCDSVAYKRPGTYSVVLAATIYRKL